MKPKEVAKATNVNYDTARKWKKKLMRMTQKEIFLLKKNLGSNRPVGQLNENHKTHLVDIF
ncbi:hypothetical protein BDF14DRAFT_1449656 [Spinellus fusiger]|nr:hypothetical protein BDF14DRAFT_1449656 [Spinellus fusiger]